jgi:CHASE3 domain sensor protein
MSAIDAALASYHGEKVVTHHISDTNDVEKIESSEFTLKEQRKIIRRVDYRLVTILGLIYCASLMDRTNLGSAAIAG